MTGEEARRPDEGPATYAETAPSAALAPWVACYWSIRGMAGTMIPTRVLPDASSDIIVDLGAAPQSYVTGAMRTAIVAPLLGRIDLFGVRFLPGGALPFLDVPLHEITDRRVALDALWGTVGAGLVDALASVPPSERVAHAERVLLQRVRVVRADDALAQRAVTLMRRARGSVGMRETAAALGVGERRLERAFDRCVGLSPKQIARVLRFQYALRRVIDGVEPTWTGVAFAAGYADQSHFIREFKALAGLTPVQLAAERRRVGFVQDGESGES